jgi:hypothetical protein
VRPVRRTGARPGHRVRLGRTRRAAGPTTKGGPVDHLLGHVIGWAIGTLIGPGWFISEWIKEKLK